MMNAPQPKCGKLTYQEGLTLAFLLIFQCAESVHIHKEIFKCDSIQMGVSRKHSITWFFQGHIGPQLWGIHICVWFGFGTALSTDKNYHRLSQYPSSFHGDVRDIFARQPKQSMNGQCWNQAIHTQGHTLAPVRVPPLPHICHNSPSLLVVRKHCYQEKPAHTHPRPRGLLTYELIFPFLHQAAFLSNTRLLNSEAPWIHMTSFKSPTVVPIPIFKK